MKIKYYYTITFLILCNLVVYGQYSISGFIETKEKDKTIYLSLLKYNERSAIYPDQILRTTKIDSTGFFEFKGEILSNESKLYRIHANSSESISGLEFYTSGKKKNYHNFIFSNTDTIFFPQKNVSWFEKSKNSNSDDTHWRELIKYDSSLNEELSKILNTEALTQAKQHRLNKLKSYCNDSISNPLVKLLAFSYLRVDMISLREDFKNDPNFYYNLKDELNEYYAGTSYYSQYQEEISKLSSSLVNEKYLFHKKLNYILGIILVLFLVLLVFILIKLKKIKNKEILNKILNLTAQEETVAQQICHGKSNKDIASNLFISLSTVKSHIGNIYSKLGVTNRQQLIQKIKNHI